MTNKKRKNISLELMTGLSSDELAEILAANPRAYMAVKGAVAEKHLSNYLKRLLLQNKIQTYRQSSGDFDKDFYVTLNNGKEISLECKNVQVLNVGSKKELLLRYLQFLHEKGFVSEVDFIKIFMKFCMKNKLGGGTAPKQCAEIFSLLSDKTTLKNKKMLLDEFPQEFKESGIPRYEFSASQLKYKSVNETDMNGFLKQFDQYPLTIDFQRTRNSTDKDGDPRRQRFYKLKEIDLVAACLFSRTMQWQFIFGHSKHFGVHKKYEDRYSNNFSIRPGAWFKDLLDCVEKPKK